MVQEKYSEWCGFTVYGTTDDAEEGIIYIIYTLSYYSRMVEDL